METTINNANRIRVLDLLRITAAAGVLLYHYCPHLLAAFPGLPWPVRLVVAVGRYGWMGVPLFFVISGFVIAMSAENKRALPFARARFMRLYPAFWISLALLFVAGRYLFHDPHGSYSFHILAANITMAPWLFHQDTLDGPYWTLLVELKFYLLIFVLLLSRQYRHYEKVLWGWFVLAAAALLANNPLTDALFPLPYVDAAFLFIAGSTYYLSYRNGWSRPRAALAALCFLLPAIAGVMRPPQISEGHNPFICAAILLAIHGAFIAISSGRDLRTKRFQSLGDLSYPLYLNHAGLGLLLFHHLHIPNGPLRLSATLILVTTAAIGVCLMENRIRCRIARLAAPNRAMNPYARQRNGENPVKMGERQ